MVNSSSTNVPLVQVKETMRHWVLEQLPLAEWLRQILDALALACHSHPGRPSLGD